MKPRISITDEGIEIPDYDSFYDHQANMSDAEKEEREEENEPEANQDKQ